ncbi:MAG TPA: ribonuclease HI family protein [Acidobacteriaceae bacterium]|nr:ribonuclease HI family protein [Acidobacteriaceae bacterium]
MPSLFPESSQPRIPPTRTNPQAWLIAHCDGGARGNPGPAGYGAVLQTESGEVLAELSEFLGVRTNNYAEYSGLLGVLAWALEHGYQRLRVVSDSELMVKQIQGRYKVNSPDLKPLWTEAHSRIAQLDDFQITHALRHKNKDADRLANAAMDRGTAKGPASGGPAEPKRELRATPYPKHPASAPPILRGLTRGGVVHLLGDAKLPDGVFVKVVPE